MVESKKLAYEDRNRVLSDPDVAPVDCEKLLAKDHVDKRRKEIKMEVANNFNSKPGEEGSDTTYFLIADDEGMYHCCHHNSQFALLVKFRAFHSLSFTFIPSLLFFFLSHSFSHTHRHTIILSPFFLPFLSFFLSFTSSLPNFFALFFLLSSLSSLFSAYPRKCCVLDSECVPSIWV